MKAPIVGIVMGSSSDAEVMRKAADFLQKLEVPFRFEIISAHRTPSKMLEYAQNACDAGYKVIIAGAGGAAHLPGMIASATVLPVIGVPILSSNSIQGWDSLLSIVQMPTGVPVATVAVNAAENAAILATQILATSDAHLRDALLAHKKELEQKVEDMNRDYSF